MSPTTPCCRCQGGQESTGRTKLSSSASSTEFSRLVREKAEETRVLALERRVEQLERLVERLVSKDELATAVHFATHDKVTGCQLADHMSMLRAHEEQLAGLEARSEDHFLNQEDAQARLDDLQSSVAAKVDAALLDDKVDASVRDKVTYQELAREIMAATEDKATVGDLAEKEAVSRDRVRSAMDECTAGLRTALMVALQDKVDVCHLRTALADATSGLASRKELSRATRDSVSRSDLETRLATSTQDMLSSTTLRDLVVAKLAEVLKDIVPPMMMNSRVMGLLRRTTLQT